MIRRRQDIWRHAIATAVVVASAVAVFVMILAPRSDWATDIPSSVVFATAMSLAFAVFNGRQILRNHDLAVELTRMLERDRLTDVATREYFYRRMAETPGAHGVLLMIDIDHFKAINDGFGHVTGDRVIHHVAQILRRNCRPEDIVCRFGGEEFVVFLRGVGAESGFAAAERLRRVIAASPLTHEDMELRVSVSVGGSLTNRGDAVDSAINAADAALYKAKELGRNRSVMSWLSPEVPARRAG
ncbi:GGDEF domain-containing protein [Tropicimonas sp. IMCC6043]|uniref:GGDEF domain-containing protein n=1 Tax=Tropicimonas sp. IMCC6043 TaxID=2510645 RepID=UPI00101DEC7A|nr:GGDEF domain-containing protein [Tropicimonas sp. IMCC6043]RYH08129.1 GGDEF domain-containing protein [Tropicimonas sp. IMCC6043]